MKLGNLVFVTERATEWIYWETFTDCMWIGKHMKWNKLYVLYIKTEIIRVSWHNMSSKSGQSIWNSAIQYYPSVICLWATYSIHLWMFHTQIHKATNCALWLWGPQLRLVIGINILAAVIYTKLAFRDKA